MFDRWKQSRLNEVSKCFTTIPASVEILLVCRCLKISHMMFNLILYGFLEINNRWSINNLCNHFLRE